METTINLKSLETRIALTVEQALEKNLKQLQKISLKFYSLDEVASMLGVDAQLVWRLCKKGEINYIRVGKLVRIEQKELLRWLGTFN